ncbi:hypothetical protein JOM56_013834 [Amanita muscaria]
MLTYHYAQRVVVLVIVACSGMWQGCSSNFSRFRPDPYSHLGLYLSTQLVTAKLMNTRRRIPEDSHLHTCLDQKNPSDRT